MQPIPPHMQECYANASWNRSSPQGKVGGRLSFPITEQIHNEELSLPIGPCITKDEISEIVRLVNEFK